MISSKTSFDIIFACSFLALDIHVVQKCD